MKKPTDTLTTARGLCPTDHDNPDSCFPIPNGSTSKVPHGPMAMSHRSWKSRLMFSPFSKNGSRKGFLQKQIKCVSSESLEQIHQKTDGHQCFHFCSLSAMPWVSSSSRQGAWVFEVDIREAVKVGHIMEKSVMTAIRKLSSTVTEAAPGEQSCCQWEKCFWGCRIPGNLRPAFKEKNRQWSFPIDTCLQVSTSSPHCCDMMTW